MGACHQSTEGKRTVRHLLPAALVGSLAVTLAAPAAAQAPAELPRTDLSGADTRTAGTAARTAAPVKSATEQRYIVRRGDTISAVAARHGLRTADVLRWNGLSWSSIIQPGQTLVLQGSGASSQTPSGSGSGERSHTVRAGETVSAIARAAGIATTAVLDANGLSWSSVIYPGQKITIPGGGSAGAAGNAAKASSVSDASATGSTGAGAKSHTVRSGDTVSAIAAQHGVATAAVLSANGLAPSSVIYPGQKITIPGAMSHPLNAPQTENARMIIRIGRELGVPERGIAIGLGTAMQESWLRNLDWGDRDSLGLFQQRPSTGWGTADQVRNRDYAIRVFFGGAGDPNGARTRGLLDIPGWRDMSFADAAQAVQISAFPDRYARWEKPAYEWLAALG